MNDPKCPQCGGEVAWGEPTCRTGARGHASCMGSYAPRRAGCGWSGVVIRQGDKSVRAASV